jgi:glutathione S-transferase
MASSPDVAASPPAAQLSLFSLPVSNYSMRNRFVIARKGIPVEILSPAAFGGMKSDKFLAINPLGKVPALVIRDAPAGGPTCIFESNCISEYLIERFGDTGPTFVPETAERRALGSMVANVLDNYVSTLHPFMYKAMDAGVDRAAKIHEMCKGFDVIESILDADGPYVAGSSLSIGDAALFGK